MFHRKTEIFKQIPLTLDIANGKRKMIIEDCLPLISFINPNTLIPYEHSSCYSWQQVFFHSCLSQMVLRLYGQTHAAGHAHRFGARSAAV